MIKFIKNNAGIGHGIILLVFLLLLTGGCSGNRIQRQIQNPEVLNTNAIVDTTSTMKFHMKNGDVYLLTNWDSDSARISGNGYLFDYNRDLVKSAKFDIPRKDIVLAAPKNSQVDYQDHQSLL